MNRQREAYESVIERAGGACEAMVFIEAPGVWTRCGRTPIQIHHMLLRARGGERLDEAGEIYHLMVLCMRCHQMAHEDRSSGLVIDGYVTDKGGILTYEGTDSYLLSRYGEGVDRDRQQPTQMQRYHGGLGNTDAGDAGAVDDE